MALPRKLKHLNLFNDGNNWQGSVESLALPKFTRKFEKYRGGGMPGAVDVDMGLDDGAIDTEFSIGGTRFPARPKNDTTSAPISNAGIRS
ncbi:UNVERIFIED_ORG: P2 family phage contractile tail tube protein [Lelliottia amnigena]|jgi:P2 family phage contractile tail tube protein|nr:P2 family phage contractile tail tube protein [Lelliottia amnigena]